MTILTSVHKIINQFFDRKGLQVSTEDPTLTKIMKVMTQTSAHVLIPLTFPGELRFGVALYNCLDASGNLLGLVNNKPDGKDERKKQLGLSLVKATTAVAENILLNEYPQILPIWALGITGLGLFSSIKGAVFPQDPPPCTSQASPEVKKNPEEINYQEDKGISKRRMGSLQREKQVRTRGKAGNHLRNPLISKRGKVIRVRRFRRQIASINTV